MRHRTRNLALVLLGSTLVGIISLLYVMRSGICVISDSSYYLMAAEALAKFHSFGTLTPDGQIKPLTVWPPLYPGLLSLFGLMGVAPAVAAKWVHAVLFGLNASLTGLLAKKISRGGLLVAATAALLFLCSTNMLSIHWVALSEPLFIFLLLTTLYLLCCYLEKPQSGWLCAAACAAGLAWLTRYSGASVAAAGALGVLLLSELKLARRIVHAAIFAFISAAPNVLWMIRNRMVAGDATGKSFGWHPATLSLLQDYLMTLIRSMLPPGSFLTIIIAAIALLGLVLLLALGWRRGKANFSLNANQRLLLIFLVTYIALVYVSISFLDANLVVDTWRLSLPIYLVGLILVVSFASQLLKTAGGTFWGTDSRRLAAACTILFLGSFAYSGARWIAASDSGEPKDVENSNLTSRYWTEAALIQAVKALPPEIPIYTNGPEALYVLLGRPVYALPQKFSATTLADNAAYAQRLQAVGEKLGGEGVVVYLNTHRFSNLPTERELIEQLSLVEVFKDGTGKMFKKGH